MQNAKSTSCDINSFFVDLSFSVEFTEAERVEFDGRLVLKFCGLHEAGLMLAGVTSKC